MDGGHFDLHWRHVHPPLRQMLQSRELSCLLDWWRPSQHQLAIQIIRQKLQTHTHTHIQSQREQIGTFVFCRRWETSTSPAGSGSPRKVHCWKTEDDSTSLFSGTRRRTRRPTGRPSDTPEPGGDGPSHLRRDAAGKVWQFRLACFPFSKKRLESEMTYFFKRLGIFGCIWWQILQITKIQFHWGKMVTFNNGAWR